MNCIRLGYNAIPKTCERDIQEVFRSGQYSPGIKVWQFEKAWVREHQSKHAIFVNSGTDALRLSLLAMKEKYHWQDGEGVAVPAMTFVATVNIILQAKLKPVFIDVDDHSYTISPEKLLDVIMSGRIVAVVPVHLFGNPVNQNVFTDCGRNGIKVLEDSCETIQNKPKGDISCHSTYMAHHVVTGVGGMAVTDDDELMWLIRSLANHGRNTAYIPGHCQPYEYEKHIKHRFQFDREGYSCRGTEFEAVMGLSQMADIDDNIAERRMNSKKLFKIFERDMGIEPPFSFPGHTWFVYPLMIRDKSIDKHDLCLHLERNGIETRDMMPITNQPCYGGIVNEDDFPVAKNINRNGFYIPCHPGVTEEDIDHIGKTFKSYQKVDKRIKVS